MLVAVLPQHLNLVRDLRTVFLHLLGASSARILFYSSDSSSTSSQRGDSSGSDSEAGLEEDYLQDDSSSTGYRLADLKILEHIICLAFTCLW